MAISVASSAPRVAAVLCTIVGPRRASARSTQVGEVVDCVRSILANTYAPLEVIVVDQSSSDAVADALRPLARADARLRHIHSNTPGLTRSQNLAVNSTSADVFAFTDDDCVVPPNWVDRIVDTFRRRPDASLLFGEVLPPVGHDWTTSFVPELRIPHEHRLLPAFLPRVNRLLGANMAIKREVFARVGLFEEGLRADPYNGEVELTFRTLRARPPMDVYLTPAFNVVHEHGARPQGEPTRRLLRTYHMGKSAMLVKHALRGDLGAACRLGLLAFEPFVDGAVNLVRTGRPSGLGMVRPYFAGIKRGLQAARPGSTEVQLHNRAVLTTAR